MFAFNLTCTVPILVGPIFKASRLLPQKVSPFADALFDPVQLVEPNLQDITIRREWATPADVLPRLQSFGLGFRHELLKNGKPQRLLLGVHGL